MRNLTLRYDSSGIVHPGLSFSSASGASYMPVSLLKGIERNYNFEGFSGLLFLHDHHSISHKVLQVSIHISPQ